MSKEQMIEAIRHHNHSVSDEFLVHFDEKTLASYLNRLTQVLGHRGRTSVWVRPETSRAVISRTCV